ncbi:LysR substrate-binding domain-containing protein [Nocardiopsis composta]|uniref:DNA-binding transcriptional LysR family regulator n=1 Tax=Nocardiopsis composta TaxID=157465 RepID=A0A7W8VF88_9ACTN|nr:LysR substrate-binding domain-containing protein [Nocardiopsis composta]MBB5433840.1 DNA-binding transcriptional LysR family regulator [Nocardiopsis composta]
MFSLEQLGSFVAVAEELHYGRAAARLSMTQPPLSRRIQLLEHELGVQLVDRSRRSVRLTPAGRAFLPDARRILRLAQEASQSVRKVPQGKGGRVALGFTAAAAYSFLGEALTELGDRLPEVDLVLREMVTGAQVEALLAGRIDLGMVRPPVSGGDIATCPLAREDLVAAVPDGHPLASRERIDAADFHGRPFVMYSPWEARYFHEVLVGAFRAAGVAPEHTQYVGQIHTVLALVRAGLGAALVPEAARALHLDGVVLRPVTGLPPAPVELHAAWRTGNDNPALAAVVQVVRELGTARPGGAPPE